MHDRDAFRRHISAKKVFASKVRNKDMHSENRFWKYAVF